jgi:RNA recognition motif-containing protein
MVPPHLALPIMSGPLFPNGPSSATYPSKLVSNNNVGTKVPNRIFVGGIPPGTTEAELEQCFARFGNIRQSKVIIDKGGQPKGYGFVTFETEGEASAVLKEVELEVSRCCFFSVR